MAKLVLLSGPAKGLEYKLGEASILGRQSSNEIPLQDLKASRQHAKIFYEEGCYYLEDMHSRNGTFVNDNPVQKHKVEKDDIIQIGDTLMQVIDLSCPPEEKKAKHRQTIAPALQEIKLTQDILSTQPIEPNPLEGVLFTQEQKPIKKESILKKKTKKKMDLSAKPVTESRLKKTSGNNSRLSELFSWDVSDYHLLHQVAIFIFILLFMGIIFWFSRWITLQIL